MPDLRTMRRDSIDQCREAGIEQYRSILGVVDDVDQLIRVQPRVAGVHEPCRCPIRRSRLPDADGCSRPPIPPHRRLEARAAQGIRQLRERAASRKRCSGATRRGSPGTRFRISPLGIRVLENGGHQQRRMHHQPGFSISLAGSNSAKGAYPESHSRPGREIRGAHRSAGRAGCPRSQLQLNLPQTAAPMSRSATASNRDPTPASAAAARQRTHRFPPSGRHVRG